MPRRSIWKGCFVDAFLLKLKKRQTLMFQLPDLLGLSYNKRSRLRK
nr:ribosomal protein S19 [Trigonella foenum-graecum]WCR63224.1 ribosomal protein S19 [Trigonella foenum-graecum]